MLFVKFCAWTLFFFNKGDQNEAHTIGTKLSPFPFLNKRVQNQQNKNLIMWLKGEQVLTLCSTYHPLYLHAFWEVSLTGSISLPSAVFISVLMSYLKSAGIMPGLPLCWLVTLSSVSPPLETQTCKHQVAVTILGWDFILCREALTAHSSGSSAPLWLVSMCLHVEFVPAVTMGGWLHPCLPYSKSPEKNGG